MLIGVPVLIDDFLDETDGMLIGVPVLIDEFLDETGEMLIGVPVIVNDFLDELLDCVFLDKDFNDLDLLRRKLLVCSCLLLYPFSSKFTKIGGV
jgi:hypothetical protein